MTGDGQSDRAQWLVQYPLGMVDATRAMGTVAAPLLAGFGLATLTLLSTASVPVRLAPVAITLFAIGSALFVFCLQFTASALLYAAPPGERVAWRLAESGDIDPAAWSALYRVQHQDTQLFRRYQFRARLTYDLGIIAHLGGLLALVAPPSWASWRIAAFAVVAAALALELWWIVGGWFGHTPRWLIPGYDSLRRATRVPDGLSRD